MNKNLLKIDDLNKDEIFEIISLGEQLKYEKKHGIEHHHLKGKSLGMIFEKSSTRTRTSFEVGMYQLGGNALFLNSNDLQMGRGEPIEDTARVLSGYLDIIMIRTFQQEKVETLAKYSSIPIINGLTDEEHPCQILADLMTIKEKKKVLEGLKVAYIGDGNNMANSLIVGCLTVGMNFSIASPIGYTPKEDYLEKGMTIAKQGNLDFTITNYPEIAVKDADVVITDVWTSMGQESQSKERITTFQGFQINANLMKFAKSDAIVLHCLPAHREEEISTEIFEKHSDLIFEEAENRLHIQKAILVKLLKGVNF